MHKFQQRRLLNLHMRLYGQSLPFINRPLQYMQLTFYTETCVSVRKLALHDFVCVFLILGPLEIL